MADRSHSGTEWIENVNVNRKGLGKGQNAEVVKDFSEVKQADIFDLLLLRGERFNHECHGAVHRSPPIEVSKENRILLKIEKMT